MVLRLHRAVRHFLQALLDDLQALAHLQDAHQVAVVAVPVLGDGDIEIHVGVNVIRLRLAKVPGNAGGAQVGPTEAPVHGLLGGDGADAHRALLENAVLGQETFAIVDDLGKTLAPRHDVVGKPSRHVEGDAAGAEISHVQAGAAHPLAKFHEDLALLETPQHGRHGANVHGEGADVEDVVEQAADLGVQDPDVLGTGRRLDAQEFLGSQREGVLLVLRRHVIEAVEIGHGLQIVLVFDQLLGAPVQHSDMGVGALDHLAVHLQHQAKDAVRRRMLRPEVHGQVLDLGFGHQPSPPSAFSSPGSTACTPSQGLRKSKLRYSWVNLTGS